MRAIVASKKHARWLSRGPTEWRSVAASAAKTVSKTSILRAKRSTATPGWASTLGCRPRRNCLNHTTFHLVPRLALCTRNEAGATQASARSGVCARFGAPFISHGRSFASKQERSTRRVAQSFLDVHMRVSRRVVRDGHRLAAAFARAKRACRGSGVYI